MPLPILAFVPSLLLVHGAPEPAIFQQSIAAYRARKSFSVGIELDALLNKNVTVGRYHLAYQAPNKVLLTKLVNGRPVLYIWINGGKFLASDPQAKEMVVRRAPTSGPMVNRLANSLGGLEDPIAAQLAPETMAAFLSPFRSLPGWKVSTRGDTIVLRKPGMVGGKKTLTDLEFSASTKLMTKALLLGPTSKLQWVFTYGPAPVNLSFSPAPGTKMVKALAEHSKIDATDPKARNLVDRSLRAYSRLSTLAYTVSGTTGSSTDWMSGKSFREQQTYSDWTYHNGIFTVLDLAHHKSYQGPCKPAAVLNYLRILRRPMDPVLHALFLHRNPISGWFVPGTKLRSHGSVTIGGVTGDAVEIRAPLFTITLLVRRDNLLVSTVTSRALTSSGATLSEAKRDFTYWAVNKPIPASSFTLKVTNPLPLTSIGK